MTITSEENYLLETTQKIEKQIDIINNSIDLNEQDYKEIKKYTVDYNNELDKYEVYNHQQNLNFIDRRNSFETNLKTKLSYLKQTPYFARIDFKFTDDEEVESFYIGRYGFVDKLGQQYVYDWRAPISSLYYDFTLGEAYYDSFGNRFDGQLELKRQFEIENGKIELMVDTNDSINDTFLVNELNKSSSKDMKTIIHTIQKDQNAAIRDMTTKNLLIQGVAGSGKTSVALHRIAYLLYQKKEDLHASDVLIVSPNEIFSDYISTVLPELGEDDLFQLDVTQLAQMLLEDELKVVGRHEEIDEVINNSNSKKAMSYLNKQSATFFYAMEEYIQRLRKKLYCTDLHISAKYCFSHEQIERSFAMLKDNAIFLQIKEAAKVLSKQIPERDRNQVVFQIEKELQKKLEIQSSLDEYEKFLHSVKEKLNKSRNKIAYSDAFPYLLFKMEIEGIKRKKTIKHIVIDEMQDYSITQYYVINKLFNCQKTICGDIHQNLITSESNLLDNLQAIMPESRLLKFSTSYRSSFEIMNFAKQFILNSTITPVNRHGKDVELRKVNSMSERKDQLVLTLKNFQESKNKTCGIICQTAEEMQLVEKWLTEIEFTSLTEKTKTMKNGLIITTPQFAKGLEFDHVILPDINEDQLKKTSNILYTCCSRALHELTLLVLPKHLAKI